ncbi:MAG: hypothetical protein AAGD35_17250 [Actinomycetota bacterium]
MRRNRPVIIMRSSWWVAVVIAAALAIGAAVGVAVAESLPVTIGVAVAVAVVVIGVLGYLWPGVLRSHRIVDGIEGAVGAPVLIDRTDEDRSGEPEILLLGVGTQVEDAEPYRMLRSRLQRLRQVAAPDGRRADLGAVVLVTSGSLPADDAKSAVATNLALVAADAGQDVLLVEADLANPRMAALFAVRSAPGLAEAGSHGERRADGSFDLRPLVQATGRDGVSLVTGGRLVRRPGDALALVDAEFFVAARREHDLVVVHAASAVDDNALIELLGHADQIVVLVDPATTNDEARNVRRLITHLAAPVAGLVLVAGEPLGAPAPVMAPAAAPQRQQAPPPEHQADAARAQAEAQQQAQFERLVLDGGRSDEADPVRSRQPQAGGQPLLFPDVPSASMAPGDEQQQWNEFGELFGGPPEQRADPTLARSVPVVPESAVPDAAVPPVPAPEVPSAPVDVPNDAMPPVPEPSLLGRGAPVDDRHLRTAEVPVVPEPEPRPSALPNPTDGPSEHARSEPPSAFGPPPDVPVESGPSAESPEGPVGVFGPGAVAPGATEAVEAAEAPAVPSPENDDVDSTIDTFPLGRPLVPDPVTMFARDPEESGPEPVSGPSALDLTFGEDLRTFEPEDGEAKAPAPTNGDGPSQAAEMPVDEETLDQPGPPPLPPPPMPSPAPAADAAPESVAPVEMPPPSLPDEPVDELDAIAAAVAEAVAEAEARTTDGPAPAADADSEPDADAEEQAAATPSLDSFPAPSMPDAAPPTPATETETESGAEDRAAESSVAASPGAPPMPPPPSIDPDDELDAIAAAVAEAAAAARTHSAVPDSAMPDAAVPDTPMPDTPMPDTGAPDAEGSVSAPAGVEATPDAAVPDPAVPAAEPVAEAEPVADETAADPPDSDGPHTDGPVTDEADTGETDTDHPADVVSDPDDTGDTDDEETAASTPALSSFPAPPMPVDSDDTDDPDPSSVTALPPVELGLDGVIDEGASVEPPGDDYDDSPLDLLADLEDEDDLNPSSR